MGIDRPFDEPRVLWRMQDKDGRGPFRPGFPSFWRDADGPYLPPFYEELGWPIQTASSRMPDGYHVGCACRSEGELHAWFSRPERRRLKRLGFEEVTFEPDLVIAQTYTQVLFGMREPLATSHAKAKQLRTGRAAA